MRAPAPGYFIIAMGKLGAFELNYSSDIDIIVFYDAERAGLKADIEPSTFFVRLTRELVRLLQEHTADGYVFRTDLRLRPDPGATQIALSTDAGLTYYESFGQNWERAALIKARIAAGDVALGEEFLGQLAPFVWRKYLDYAAIADIHAMKRRVHAYKGHGAIAVEGHDIKLGRGGIRDIEFFAQTQQLIAGGRHPELRTRGTIETLERLAEGGWIAKEAASDLTEAYLFLRRIENRLQMVGDQQTHIIPAERDELERVAKLSGFADTDSFGDALLGRFKRVETHYGALFEKLPELPSAAPTLVISADEKDPAAIASLERLGFRNPAAAIAAVRAWQSGRYAATRSTRSRERLTEFLPSLLDAFGRTADPDLALATFDKVIADMPAGVQLFSLLAANPSLLRLIADIMGTAPRLARIIGRRPRLLRCRARSGLLRCGADPRQAQGAGRRGAGRGARLSGGAGPRPHRRPRAGLPHRRQGDLGHALGAAGGRRLCGACRDTDRGACREGRGRARPHLWPHAGRPGGGDRHGQARRARDDRRLRSRSDHRLRLCGGGRPVGRGEEPARAAILFALHPTPDRGAVGGDRRRLALSGRYAAQAVRQPGSGGDEAVELRRLSAKLSLDLGASCVDPRARGHGSSRAQAADQRYDQAGAVAPARPRRRGRRCQGHARQDRRRQGKPKASGT